MTAFSDLIKEFALVTDSPFYSEDDESRYLRINGKYHLQMKMDPGREKLFVGCVICEIPPGKFRENVLKEALKENNEPPPNPGIFAFFERDHSLFLFDYLFFQYLSGEKLSEYLQAFIEKITAWDEAILADRTSPHPENTPADTIPPHGIKT